MKALADCKTVADYRRWAKERDLKINIQLFCHIVIINQADGAFIARTYGPTRLTAVRMACAAAEARGE